LFAALLVAFAFTGGADAQVVNGRVLERASGSPVRHATVDLLDEKARVVGSANVDTAGAFHFRQWRAGEFRLRTSALGFAPVRSDVLTLATGDVLDLTIRLDVDAVRLEPVVINTRARETLAEIALAGYYDRRATGRRLGTGRFLDRPTLVTRGRKLTEVLATVTGLRILHVQGCPAPIVSIVGNAANRLSGEPPGAGRPLTADACRAQNICRANIFVDGVEMLYNQYVSIDDTVPLDWIEAVEVYRRPSETPAEFLGRATCGVVAIWTRRG
jgi:hypothetical protein